MLLASFLGGAQPPADPAAPSQHPRELDIQLACGWPVSLGSRPVSQEGPQASPHRGHSVSRARVCCGTSLTGPRCKAVGLVRFASPGSLTHMTFVDPLPLGPTGSPVFLGEGLGMWGEVGATEGPSRGGRLQWGPRGQSRGQRTEAGTTAGTTPPGSRGAGSELHPQGPSCRGFQRVRPPRPRLKPRAQPDEVWPPPPPTANCALVMEEGVVVLGAA